MSNYLVAPKLYKTGFLSSNANVLRIKQGLTPQDISNVCYIPSPSTNTSYDEIQREITQSDFHPAKQTQLDYRLPKIPNNCPCLDYLSKF